MLGELFVWNFAVFTELNELFLFDSHPATTLPRIRLIYCAQRGVICCQNLFNIVDDRIDLFFLFFVQLFTFVFN